MFREGSPPPPVPCHVSYVTRHMLCIVDELAVGGFVALVVEVNYR